MTRSRVVASLAAVLLCTVASGPPACDGAEVTVTSPTGDSVAWSGWVRDHGPLAVVLWASWAPGADRARTALDELAKAAEERGFELVLVAVQEPFDEAAGGLEGVRVQWFHDRHGALLKQYRVVSIPALVVLDAEGRVITRLEATARSLRGWEGQ
ncbi:MAG TPA: redoxin domain-containing protein [Methylomirabilota bacterium]|nr:redoxin domain-containing protein [Methylomirabilota bacterium]